jgi:beta-galactosidase
MVRQLAQSILLIFLLACCKPAQERHSTLSDFGTVSRVDSGRAVAVMLTVYRTTLVADGRDNTLLRIAVSDSVGREIRTASDKIRIYLEGDALISAAGKGKNPVSAVDTSGAEYFQYQLEDGLAWLELKAGEKPDKIRLVVRSGTLWPGLHEIHTIHRDVELLTPRPGQIRPGNKEIERMIGADISFLPQFEDRGRKYFENGEEKDAVHILADHGFNYIKLRIFVNPENEKGYSPDRGFCGLDHTLRMARRIKDAGMKLIINFHYSDYWADAQRQNKPAAWESLSFEALKDTLEAYTEYVLLSLEQQGTPAHMVLVGNEINHGLLWPDGHIGRPDQLAELLKAGVRGVRTVDKNIPVMMHLALGGQNEEAVFWFDNMIARGVEFDIMGVSYYPRWHGTLEDLEYNLTDLVQRYKKPVNVVEYSIFREEIHRIVFKLPDNLGNGTCLWEPVGYRGRLFDREGKLIEGMLLYEKLSDQYLE